MIRRIAVRLVAAAAAVAVCVAAGIGAFAGAGYQNGFIPDPTILLPAGPAVGTVFLISAGAHWTPEDTARAEKVRRAGAAVVGIDRDAWLGRITEEGPDCVYLVSDFEELSQELERQTGASDYAYPIVAGTGMGGALVLDIATGVPEHTLGALIAADPSASVPLRVPLCVDVDRRAVGAGGAYDLPKGKPVVPLTVITTPGADAGSTARVAAMKARGVEFEERRTRAAGADAVVAAAIAALGSIAKASDTTPVVELPTTPQHDTLAIILSGDGGWRDIDQEVGDTLHAEGVPVLGVDSLRYFWSLRTPDELARDLDTLIDTYTRRWNVSKVALVGYSFGADVLPEAWSKMTETAKAKVSLVSLLAPSKAADWEITVSGFIVGASSSARTTVPWIEAMPGGRLQCIFGEEEKDESGCSVLRGTDAELVSTPGGHHFDGDYKALATRILARIDRRQASSP